MSAADPHATGPTAADRPLEPTDPKALRAVAFPSTGPVQGQGG